MTRAAARPGNHRGTPRAGVRAWGPSWADHLSEAPAGGPQLQKKPFWNVRHGPVLEDPCGPRRFAAHPSSSNEAHIMKHLIALMLALGTVTLVACESNEQHPVEDAQNAVSLAISGMT